MKEYKNEAQQNPTSGIPRVNRNTNRDRNNDPTRGGGRGRGHFDATRNNDQPMPIRNNNSGADGVKFLRANRTNENLDKLQLPFIKAMGINGNPIQGFICPEAYTEGYQFLNRCCTKIHIRSMSDVDPVGY